MSRLLALTRREVMAYFYAPVPYLVMFLFLLMTFQLFQFSLRSGSARVDYAPVFESLVFILLFLMPLLTMNTLAEERSRNTLETLLTAPVTDWQVVLSKWFGTFLFYVVMLLPTLVYWAVLARMGQDIGKPESGPVLAAYVGAVLLGGLYIAIGVFASSLTENSLLSAFVAFFVLIALILVNALPFVEEGGSEWVRATASYVSQQTRFDEFLKGRITLHDVLYFVTMTVLFQFLAVRALESRKWR